MLLKGGAFPVSGNSGHSEAKGFAQHCVAAPESKSIQGSVSPSVIPSTRKVFPKPKLPKTTPDMSKVLGLMFALALGLALGTESPGGPSKVTADTGKVAAPLAEEEASCSSLGFKVSAFAEEAASAGQGSEGKSEDQPQGSQESQDQSESSQV